MLEVLLQLLFWNPWLIPLPFVVGYLASFGVRLWPGYLAVLTYVFLGLVTIWIGSTAIGGYVEMVGIFDRRFMYALFGAGTLYLLGAWLENALYGLLHGSHE